MYLILQTEPLRLRVVECLNPRPADRSRRSPPHTHTRQAQSHLKAFALAIGTAGETLLPGEPEPGPGGWGVSPSPFLLTWPWKECMEVVRLPGPGHQFPSRMCDAGVWSW